MKIKGLMSASFFNNQNGEINVISSLILMLKIVSHQLLGLCHLPCSKYQKFKYYVKFKHMSVIREER